MRSLPNPINRQVQRVAGVLAGLVLPLATFGQVNSGSDGSDGALEPTGNITVDMHDHPDGVYQYTWVNIPNGVTVSFIPNDANTAVVWLVQGDCAISGNVDVNGKATVVEIGGAGGPGGFRGGNGPLNLGQVDPGPGQGPGGGKVSAGNANWLGGNASYATLGQTDGAHHPPGDLYGNTMLIPLLGGSGGGGGYGSSQSYGGGGGGGAILIACSGTVTLAGASERISAWGWGGTYGGDASGGAVRIVATTVTGGGSIDVRGYNNGGYGRVRIEALINGASGQIIGSVTYGVPGIILPPAGQSPTLSLASIGGVGIPPNPSGMPLTPDAVIPAEQQNPVSIVVSCHNVPLNSQVTVDVKPYNGATVSGTGLNSVGTVGSSTATVTLSLPPGAGTIQAKAIGCPLGMCKLPKRDEPGKKPSLLETGLAANGERFTSFDVLASLGGRSQVVYVTESGERFPATWLASVR